MGLKFLVLGRASIPAPSLPLLLLLQGAWWGTSGPADVALQGPPQPRAPSWPWQQCLFALVPLLRSQQGLPDQALAGAVPPWSGYVTVQN